MTWSPSDIATRDFPVVRRGYDPALVRAFLADLADDLERERELQPVGGAASVPAPVDGVRAQEAVDAADQLLASAARHQARSAAREAAIERSMVLQARFQRDREHVADAVVAGAEATAAAIVRAAQVEAAVTANRRWNELSRAIIAILERARTEADAVLVAAHETAAQIRRQVLAELVGLSPADDEPTSEHAASVADGPDAGS